jgi:formylmethanofuran--tetrahydromethanopterin N-formyltransferase
VQINGVTIIDTFAEAFPMWAARLVITARSLDWARTAGETAAGLATSIVGCGCEAGIDAELSPEQNPDGRPGVAVLAFTVTREALEGELLKRIGQGVLTCPTTACYNGLDSEERAPIGSKLRYFGDGFQASKVIGGRRYWRVPVGDGEFLVEESFGLGVGVGGGNLLILARDAETGLQAASAAAQAVRGSPGAIAPFPGGVCRSPSKPGARYRGVRASTNQAFCPTLRGRVESQVMSEAQAVYELVIDGLSESAVGQAMVAAARAACQPGVLAITAGNYGGKLGPYHFHLRQLLTGEGTCA